MKKKIATMYQFQKPLEREVSMKRKTFIFIDFGHRFSIFVEHAFSE